MNKLDSIKLYWSQFETKLTVFSLICFVGISALIFYSFPSSDEVTIIEAKVLSISVTVGSKTDWPTLIALAEFDKEKSASIRIPRSTSVKTGDRIRISRTFGAFDTYKYQFESKL